MSSIAVAGSGGSGSITINTTSIIGGANLHVLYDNAGTVGEMANFTNSSGNPNVTSGNAYFYNGVNTIQAITSLSDFYFGNSGNLGTTANNEIALGAGALATANVGDGTNGRNVAIGVNALNAGSAVLENVAIGHEAMAVATSISDCVAVGEGAMQNATGGLNNVAIGHGALNSNTTGSANSALGVSALSANTAGAGNSADGSSSLQHNTLGNNNFAMGTQSMQQNIDGVSNVGIGFQALNANDHGSFNIVIGSQSLDSLVGSTSTNNTVVGGSAGRGLASGSDTNNVFIGSHAGNSITAGNGNVVIGAFIPGPVGTASNTISIGTGGNAITGTLQLDFAVTNAGKWTWAASPVLPGFTVSTLPTGVLGARAYVTDGDAGLAWGATAVNSGAGATKYQVWYNGTNWTVEGK